MKKVRLDLKKIIIALLIILIIVPEGLFVQISRASSDIKLESSVYLKDYGWCNIEKESFKGNTDKELEAIKIDINNDKKENLSYSVYIKNEGWTPYVNCGEIVGKISRNTPIEKIKIKLNGYLEKKYDVEYRVNFGNSLWSKWFKNGEIAGNKVTKTLYSIEIRIVEKNK